MRHSPASRAGRVASRLRVPRDLSGAELSLLMRRYDYQVTRRTGSHMRLTSTLKGSEHHVTIPRHQNLRVGRLSAVLKDVAAYLDLGLDQLMQELFGKSRDDPHRR